jgi:hypothetical protein
MKQTLFENEVIYIPFLNFYQDKTIFAILVYPDKKHLSGPNVFTLTSDIYTAIYKYTLNDAVNIFKKHFKGVCPKRLWSNCGLIKTTYQKLIDSNIKYKQDKWGGYYISIRDIKKNFELVPLIL